MIYLHHNCFYLKDDLEEIVYESAESDDEDETDYYNRLTLEGDYVDDDKAGGKT